MIDSFPAIEAYGLIYNRPLKSMLLLKKQVEHDPHSFDNPRKYWAVPGGAIETGEDPAAGLCRLVREMAGLHLPVQTLSCAFNGVKTVRNDGQRSSKVYQEFMTADAAQAPLKKTGYPYVVEAEWVPYSKVIILLREHSLLSVIEPVKTFLQNGPTNDVWHYIHNGKKVQRMTGPSF